MLNTSMLNTLVCYQTYITYVKQKACDCRLKLFFYTPQQNDDWITRSRRLTIWLFNSRKPNNVTVEWWTTCQSRLRSVFDSWTKGNLVVTPTPNYIANDWVSVCKKKVRKKDTQLYRLTALPTTTKKTTERFWHAKMREKIQVHTKSKRRLMLRDVSLRLWGLG